MRELQMSNTDVARRAGVDRSHITKLLRGARWSMRPETVAKIERALGLKVGAIAALGSGKTLRSQVATESASTDLVDRVEELEHAVEEQRRLIEALVGRRDVDRGARR